MFQIFLTHSDSKVHGANMGNTWVLSAPDGPHVGPMNLAIRDTSQETYKEYTGFTQHVRPYFGCYYYFMKYPAHRSLIPWSLRPQEFIPIIIFQACFYQSSGGPWSAIKTYLFRNSAIAQTYGHYRCFHEIITSFMWSFYGWILIVNQNLMIRLWTDTLTQEYQSIPPTIFSLLSVPQASESCC